MSRRSNTEGGDPVEVDAGVEEPEETPDPGAPYEALVIDPPPEPVPAEEAIIEEPKETPLEVPTGSVALVYRGSADLVEHGEYRFRPGEPVVVPSETAEELLTMPFERFETV
jgi:hypothetical protein